MIELKKFSIIDEFNSKELQNISFPSFGHILVFGLNGSGKTSLMKSIMNIQEFSGNIYIDGLDNKQIETGRMITYLPENIDDYFFTESVFNEFLLAEPKIKKETIKLLLEKYRLEHIINRKPQNLSGGEKIRLAYALMEVRNINIILIDEPLVMNDSEAVLEMKKFINDYGEKKLVIECTVELERLFSAAVILYVEDGIITRYDGWTDLCENEYLVEKLNLKKEPLYWLGKQ